ncbi:hypothetical protein DL96DRAFT_1578655 [Flagelloscypha sp. PMI_526]|nr:hypothetical protein DL96DRAFT_1578655 [Flagelloscypha sp. PMI_526]
MGTSPPAQTPTESDQTLMQPQPLQVCVTSPGNPEDPPANVMTTCPTVHAININLRLKGEPFKNSLLSLFWQYTFYPNPNPTPDDLILGISPIASEAGVRMSVVGIVSDGFEVSKVHSQLEFNKADIEDQFYSSSPADYGFDRGSVRQKNTSNSSSQWTTNAPVGFPRAGPMANFGYSSMKGKGSGSEVGGDEKHRDWVVDVAGSNFPSPSSHSHRFIVSRTTPSSLAKSDNIRPMLSATFGMRLEEHVPPPSCKDPIVFKQTHQVFVWTSSKPPRGIIIIVEHELLDMTTTTAAVVRANLAISCPPLLPSATLPAEKITGETSVVSWTKAGETHENFGAALELVPVQEFTLRSRNPILEVPVRPVAANGWDVSSNDWLSAPWPEIIYDEDNPGEVLMDTEPL